MDTARLNLFKIGKSSTVSALAEFGLIPKGTTRNPSQRDPAKLGLRMGVSVIRIGAHGERETPVPIPNTEVKPLSGYNTWGPPLGK